MKKLVFSITMIFVLSLFIAPTALGFPVDVGNVPDGTYTGSDAGFNDDVVVEVTVSGGEVTNIEVVDHDETPDYFEDGVVVIDDIIAAQSTAVDTETGATATSDAIVGAVQNALAGEEVEEEPAEEPDEEVEEEEDLPETGGGVIPMLPGIGGIIAAGGAYLLLKRK